MVHYNESFKIDYFKKPEALVLWVIVGPRRDGKLQVVVRCVGHKFGRDNPHIRVVAGLDGWIFFP